MEPRAVPPNLRASLPRLARGDGWNAERADRPERVRFPQQMGAYKFGDCGGFSSQR